MSVKLFVISNGEKVVADVLDENDNVIKVKNPIVLKDVMTDKGISAYPVPLVPTNNSVVEITKSSLIVLPCDPEDQILKAYHKLTSNIVIPESSLVV